MEPALIYLCNRALPILPVNRGGVILHPSLSLQEEEREEHHHCHAAGGPAWYEQVQPA